MKPKLLTAILTLIVLFIIANESFACYTPPSPSTAFLKSDMEMRTVGGQTTYHTMTGARVTFDARDSYSGSFIYKYEFDFDYHNGSEFNPSYTERIVPRDHYFDGLVTHTFTAAGTYTVYLRVTGGGVNAATCTVVVHKGVASDGSSDYTDLPTAVAAAGDGDEIWVAPDYVGDIITLPDKNVVNHVLVRGIKLDTPQRLGVDQYPIQMGQGVDLRGFILGNVICSNISSPPYIRNCWFLSPGCGLKNINSSPIVENCVFAKCDRGVWNQGNSNPKFKSCLFASNHLHDGSDGLNGAAMWNQDQSSPTIINCTIASNKATGKCGGIYNDSAAAPTIKNCIFWANKDDDSTTSDFQEQIYGGNPTITYSCIQGGGTANGNINANPGFVFNLTAHPPDANGNPCGIYNCSWPAGEDDTYGTLDDAACLFPGLATDEGNPAGSPCIDAGAPSTTTDEAGEMSLSGFPRILDGDYDNVNRVDMGAYEIPRIWFVCKHYSPHGNTGKSWYKAFDELSTALNNPALQPGDQIWVAGSQYDSSTIYYPCDSGGSRTNSFVLKPNVAVYGEFSGNDTWHSKRDIRVSRGVLSGDIGTANDNNDNCYHIVQGADGAVLDGFVITGGHADGTGDDGSGGGMSNINVSVTVRNCIFTGNYSRLSGAGILNNGTGAVIENCTFANNTAATGYGGAIYNCSPYGAIYQDVRLLKTPLSMAAPCTTPRD